MLTPGIQGKAESMVGGGTMGWHGSEELAVCLKERKFRVERPQRRRKEQDHTVPIPAHEALI